MCKRAIQKLSTPSFCAWTANASLTAFLFLGFLLSSCTVTTGIRISPSRSDLAKISSVGIIVKKEKDFTVRFFREGGVPGVGGALVAADIARAAPGPGTGALAGIAVTATLIGAAVLNSADAQLEEQFTPITVNYDPSEVMRNRLRHHLQLKSPKVFGRDLRIAVEDYGVLKNEKTDALLVVTLKEWGLRPCRRHNTDGAVQVTINFHGKMSLLENGTTIWDRVERYIHANCHTLNALSSSATEFQSVFGQSIDNLAGKIVNEILYP